MKRTKKKAHEDIDAVLKHVQFANHHPPFCERNQRPRAVEEKCRRQKPKWGQENMLNTLKDSCYDGGTEFREAGPWKPDVGGLTSCISIPSLDSATISDRFRGANRWSPSTRFSLKR